MPELYAVLNLTTSGLSPGRGDRVIEIAIVLISNGEEIDTYSSLINANVGVDPPTIELTGISNQMLSSAPPANEVLAEAVKFIGDAQLVAHNANFDKKFWRHELQQALGRDDEREFVCTLMLSRRVFQSFTSHKLQDLAQDLGITASSMQRTLTEAQLTSRVLSSLLGRLRVVYRGEAIDGRFLLWYQQKNLSSLPDLTTKTQTLKAGNISATIGEQTGDSISQNSDNEGVICDARTRAAAMHADAVDALQMLDNLQVLKSEVPVALDWDGLVNSRPFRATLERRTFIVYGEDGMPSDIEYLSMQATKPEEPLASPRPIESEFIPDIGILDKLVFRERRLIKGGENTYSEALRNWESERQQQMAEFVQADNQWAEAAKDIDLENDRRYQQCLEDQKQWWENKQSFDEQFRLYHASVDCFKQSYFLKETKAVVRYVYEALSRITYPDYFADEASVTYEADTKTVEVRIRLILPDDMPRVESVSYVESRDEIRNNPLSPTARHTLYGNVARSVCVRTIDEVVGSDTAGAVEYVIVNGYVKTVDFASGLDQEGVIASILTGKKQYLDQRSECVDATACFEALGGRGTVRSIPRLNSVMSFTFDDVVQVVDLT